MGFYILDNNSGQLNLVDNSSKQKLHPFSNLKFFAVNCQMNIYQNSNHINPNTHLQTLYETLLRTYTYSNLT